MKYVKNEKIIFWGVPALLFLLIIFLSGGVKSKIAENAIGKPEILTASSYGEVAEVLVQPGDMVEPGKVMVRYIITDKNGNGGNQKSNNDALDVTVRKLEYEKFIEKNELPGIIVAEFDSNLFSQVSGVVEKINFRQGEWVSKGTVLINIEKEDYQIMFDSAKVSFDLAKTQYERVKMLRKENAVSKSEFDNVEAQFRQSEAQFKNARLALDRCEIKAPFNGIVNSLQVEVGELVNPGQELLNFIDISRVKAIIGIPEQDISHVRGLKEMGFSVPSLGNQKYTAKVNNVSFSPAEMSRVYPLELIIDNSEKIFLPGMIIKADVVRNVYDNAILLPLFSIIPGDNEYYTYVEKNGKASRRNIKLGSLQGNIVHVVEGLKMGENLISDGLRLVTEGTALNIIE